MLRHFERLVDPYPTREPTTPPSGFWPFVWHYSRDVWPWVMVMALAAAAIGLGEAFLYGFMGTLVDWLTERDRATLMAEEGWTLALVGAAILVGLPGLVLFQTAIVHQTLSGNYPMLVRWLAHRQLLRQPVAFYADEFAGRIATKVMQTAIAVRDTVLRIFDIFAYVLAYFVGMLTVAAQADWRLMLPMIAWAIVYGIMLAYFVPRLAKVSEAQADARSMMTGRIVDSYTNIQTVKLFSHAQRERDYAREAMDDFLVTVHRQMRLVSWFNAANYATNAVLLFTIGALGISFWLQRDNLARRLRGVADARPAPQRPVALGDVGDDDAVRGGRHHRRRQDHAVQAPHRERRARGAEARRAGRRDPLRGGALPLRQGRRRDRPSRPHGARRREDRPRRPVGRRQDHADRTSSCASTTSSSGAS